MSTLDINNNTIKKTIITYLIISILTYVASVIYLKFSYGVVSIFMQYVALIPLILGLAIFSIIKLIKRVKHSRIAYNLYNAGIATLTFGTAIKGILDICGSSSKFVVYFWGIGLTEIVIAIIFFIIKQLKKSVSE